MGQNKMQNASINFSNRDGENKLEISQGVIIYIQTPLFTYNIMDNETYTLYVDSCIQFFKAALDYNLDLFIDCYRMLNDKTIANSVINDKILNTSNNFEKDILKRVRKI